MCLTNKPSRTLRRPRFEARYADDLAEIEQFLFHWRAYIEYIGGPGSPRIGVLVLRKNLLH